jgi:pimeloyl-ACP methyl ester carboxylesterase
MGGLIRTGQDMSAADTLQAIERYGPRPLLIISGGQDRKIGGGDAQALEAAARDGGSEAELHVCDAAGHAAAPDACGDEYAEWVLGFLARALASPV